MLAIIPTFIQKTYLKNTINQLSKFKINNFLIIDSYSNDEDMYNYLKSIESDKVKVIYLKENLGPRYFYTNKELYNSLPQNFIVTDPDLKYNESLPKTFVLDLLKLTEEYKVGKAGLALDISQSQKITEECRLWEKKYWSNKIGYTKYNDPIYKADIDTTFAVYNKEFIKNTTFPGDFFKSIRVAGKFTAKHLGWYIQKNIPEEELKRYKENQKWSSTESNYGQNKEWYGSI